MIMIDRAHIEKILKLNGLAPDSPDDEIKALLISAKWHERDVETALVVLREDSHQEKSISAVRQVLHSDEKIISSTDLQSLLGMEVDVRSVPSVVFKTQSKAIRAQICSMVIVSVVIAGLSLLGMMWLFKIDIFSAYL